MKKSIFKQNGIRNLIVLILAAIVATSLHGQNLTPDQMRRFQALNPDQQAELMERLHGSVASTKPVVGESVGLPGSNQPELDKQTEKEGLSIEEDTTVTLAEYELELEVDLLRLEKLLNDIGSDESERRLQLTKRLAAARSLLDQVRSLQLKEIQKRVDEIEKPSEPELRPFGHDLFSETPSTFAPVDDAPVPPDYVVGPGDILEVQIFGKENRQYALTINRDGLIKFPEIGPVNVFERGADFQSLKTLLRSKVLESYGEGVQTSVSMGPLRSIRIFLLGDVFRPGSYVVSSLSTLTNALFAGGGVTEIGSMRNIQLKRKGELIGQFDLYDLLLRGDTSKDRQVQPGDVIFAPSVGSVVGVSGAIRRPALYELKDEKELGELLVLAGGLLPSSFESLCRVERVDDSGRREVRNVDLSKPEGLGFQLQDGDMVHVFSSLVKFSKIVGLKGHVERPGKFQWRPGLRLVDLVPNKEALLEKPDLDYALVRRENLETGEVTAFSFSPRIAFSNSDSKENLELEPKDQVFFFDGQNSKSRHEIVNSLLEELRHQTRPGANASLVSVSGPVHFPGEYPLAEGMRISDLILAGGNMKDVAYVLSAELTRYHYKPDGGVGIEHLTIASLSDLANNPEQDLPLQPYDNLRIKPLPDWAERGTVEILGEVRFPGIYPIRRGETLSEALNRAGGLTEHAFANGSVFLRESLKQKEAKRKEQLMARLEADLALLSIEKASGDALQAGSLAQSLLAQLRKTESVGRMVINLSGLLDEKGIQPLFLEKGDKLIVPIRPQEVMVMGEVQHPTSHLYNKRLSLKDYVSLSGGFTYKADQKRVFVVKADGSVGGARGSSWFPLNSSGLSPGDTVVVPLDVDRGQALKKIANLTQIVYQMALAAAAVNSF